MTDAMAAKTEEPGACPFCAWDHPGDTHSKACVIGRHVGFAHARGVADERARVVADLRTHKWHPGGAKGAIQPETAALRYERGEHTKEGA